MIEESSRNPSLNEKELSYNAEKYKERFVIPHISTYNSMMQKRPDTLI